jgi:hypothetical protein
VCCARKLESGRWNVICSSPPLDLLVPASSRPHPGAFPFSASSAVYWGLFQVREQAPLQPPRPSCSSSNRGLTVLVSDSLFCSSWKEEGALLEDTDCATECLGCSMVLLSRACSPACLILAVIHPCRLLYLVPNMSILPIGGDLLTKAVTSSTQMGYSPTVGLSEPPKASRSW